MRKMIMVIVALTTLMLLVNWYGRLIICHCHSPAAPAHSETSEWFVSPKPILTVFYRSAIESILTSCITVWYGN